MPDPGKDLPPWIPDLGNGRYRNPVIHADYSDPDVIRVGGDFYMVASSFNFIPGLPILHSRDLVNWTLIGHALPRLGWPGYELPAHGKAVWAPSIRHHNGWFHVFFASPDEGVFMVRARQAEGPWEAPVQVKKAVGWIDPCPFWDDDGTAWLVNGFANSRIGFKSVLRLNRMSPDGTALLPEGRFIFDGQDRHQTMEGPKLYKRNGWYYIFAPAGGVTHGWQTVLRSRNIWGPYEDRIVLHQGNSATNGPHQGGWVDTGNGEDWFLHFQDKGPFGRVVHLQPMSWDFDWPRIGVDSNNDGIGEPVDTWTMPRCATVSTGPSASPRPCGPACSDDFRSPTLGLQWQWLADPQPHWHAMVPERGALRLNALPYPRPETPWLPDCPHVLCQKFPAPSFQATVRVEAAEGSMACLSVIGRSYAGIGVISRPDGTWLVLIRGRDRLHHQDVIQKIGPAGMVTSLGVQVDSSGTCRFLMDAGGGQAETWGEDFQAEPGVWVGANLGLACIPTSRDSIGASHAHFSAFRVSPWQAEQTR